jgi:hypothetical protein
VEHRRNGERPAAGLDSVAVAHDEKTISPSGDPRIRELRSSDLEPYTGLRYLSKLFRFMAIIMLLLLVAELVTGVYTQGAASIPTLLGEASRLIVLAGVLWGTGDLAHLLIDVGHDVRAGRIMMARATHGGLPFMPNGFGGDLRDSGPRSVEVVVSDRAVGSRGRPVDLGPPSAPPSP